MKVSSPYFDPEFDGLRQRIYGPKVSIDNESMEDCTVIKVDGINKQGLLLEVVQLLTHLNLSISKTYISADGNWFMDVFHAKDEKGKKLTDQSVIDYIQQAIGSTRLDDLNLTNWAAGAGTRSRAQPDKGLESEKPSCDHTIIEMTGADRPGLLSEISAALSDLDCKIIEAHAWTHNSRLACVAHLSYQHRNDNQINWLDTIEDRFISILNAGKNISRSSVIPMVTGEEAKTPDYLPAAGGRVECSVTDLERRLHQLMLSARDFDESASLSSADLISRTKHVVVEDCDEKGYLIVSIKCEDRPKLMFDCVCTLTDMQYVIFHASGSSSDGYAFQEYFIRHVDGSTSNTENEKERIVKCVEAALERRFSKGVRLELFARDIGK